MCAAEKEAIEIITDLEDVGFLEIDEIREMLVMGTKDRKTNERIEDTLMYIAKNKKYKKLKEKFIRRRNIERYLLGKY